MAEEFKELEQSEAPVDQTRTAMADELKGLGNVDVYADAKYGQNLYVLPYPCPEDKDEALEESLIIALDANVSYNAVRM